jgi:DNA-directed RNA polymerase specialized sigma24 family protein
LGLSSISGQQRAKIIERTSSLLRQIGVHEVAVESGFERVEEILDSYSELNLAKSRELLFLQELTKATESSGEHKRRAILSKLIKRLDGSMLSAAFDISIGTAKRRMYRRFG